MDWQQAVSLVVVGTAAAALAASYLRRRKWGWEPGGVCGGCTARATAPTRSSIVLRARKGERPEVVLRLR